MLSDHLSPIVVRDARQWVRSRGLAFGVAGALVAIAMVAAEVATAGDIAVQSGHAGRVGARAALSVMAWIVQFFLPLLLLASTAAEAPSFESLALTRVTPWQYLRGRLLGAAAVAGVVLGVFLPLLAVILLLRGVDSSQIAIRVALLTLCGLGACGFTIALGMLGRNRVLMLIAWPIALVPLAVQALAWTSAFAALRPADVLPAVAIGTALVESAIAIPLVAWGWTPPSALRRRRAA